MDELSNKFYYREKVSGKDAMKPKPKLSPIEIIQKDIRRLFARLAALEERVERIHRNQGDTRRIGGAD